MFTCSMCKTQFHIWSLYNAHTQKCIPVSTFTTHSGQQVIVERNEGGTFLCYCSHSSFQNIYRDQGAKSLGYPCTKCSDAITVWRSLYRKTPYVLITTSDTGTPLGHNSGDGAKPRGSRHKARLSMVLVRHCGRLMGLRKGRQHHRPKSLW